MNEWDISGKSVAHQSTRIHTTEKKFRQLASLLAGWHCLFLKIMSLYPSSLIRTFLHAVKPLALAHLLVELGPASGSCFNRIPGRNALLVIVQSWFYFSFRNGLACIHGTTRQITIRFVYIIVPSCFETLSGDKQPTSIVDKNLEFFPISLKKHCGRSRTLGQMAFKGIKD